MASTRSQSIHKVVYEDGFIGDDLDKLKYNPVVLDGFMPWPWKKSAPEPELMVIPATKQIDPYFDDAKQVLYNFVGGLFKDPNYVNWSSTVTDKNVKYKLDYLKERLRVDALGIYRIVIDKAFIDNPVNYIFEFSRDYTQMKATYEIAVASEINVMGHASTESMYIHNKFVELWRLFKMLLAQVKQRFGDVVLYGEVPKGKQQEESTGKKGFFPFRLWKKKEPKPFVAPTTKQQDWWYADAKLELYQAAQACFEDPEYKEWQNTIPDMNVKAEVERLSASVVEDLYALDMTAINSNFFKYESNPIYTFTMHFNQLLTQHNEVVRLDVERTNHQSVTSFNVRAKLMHVWGLFLQLFRKINERFHDVKTYQIPHTIRVPFSMLPVQRTLRTVNSRLQVGTYGR